MNSFYSYTLRTHTGLIRSSNQDRIKVLSSREMILDCLLADGMGGHQGGDLAATLAIECFEKFSFPSPEIEENISSLFQNINEKIKDEQRREEKLKEMGTTLVYAQVKMLPIPEIYLAHIGDSRAYLLLDKNLFTLTKDHSVGEEMLAQNLYSSRDLIGNRKEDFALFKALGHIESEGIKESMSSCFLPSSFWKSCSCQNWCLLLCSDGLHGVISHQTMQETLIKTTLSLEEKSEELLARALEAGGRDNISFILIEKTEKTKE